jgi:hypothetical protein
MSNPLTAQIAADPDVAEARRNTMRQLVQFGDRDGDSPLRDPYVLTAMDTERDAVIAATQRVMQEGAQPAEVLRLQQMLERERAASHHWIEAARKTVAGHSWVTQTRDSYAWDDDEFFKEALHLFKALDGLLERAENETHARDLTDCKLPPVVQESASWGVTQTITGEKDGNCLEAAIATVLGCDISEVPKLVDDIWRDTLTTFFISRGVDWMTVDAANPPRGLSIAVGPSPRRTVRHAVVAINGVLAFDPHPDRTFFGGSPILYFIELTPVAALEGAALPPHDWPKANERDAANGWTYDTGLIEQIQDGACCEDRSGCADGDEERPSMECVEATMKACAKLWGAALPPVEQEPKT